MLTLSRVFRSGAWSRDQAGVALVVLRVLLGVVFIGHGGQKLLGLWGGHGVKGFETQVIHLGFPAPLLFAYLAGLAEFGGGILLVLGLLARLGALGILVNMLVAIFGVHLSNGLLGTPPSKPGFDFPLVCVASAITVLILGAGPFSIDAWIGSILETRAGTAAMSSVPARPRRVG